MAEALREKLLTSDKSLQSPRILTGSNLSTEAAQLPKERQGGEDMVLVCIWLPKKINGERNIGHGSMLITSDREDDVSASTYVSNWPSSMANLFYGKGQASPDFSNDQSSEGRLPELVYRIVGLDEKAMVNRWTEMKKDLKYSFLVFNCFTTVAEVVRAGLNGVVGYNLGDTFIRHEAVVVHAVLICFVQQVQLALRGKLAENVPFEVVK